MLRAMNRLLRRQFDLWLEEVLGALPPNVAALLEETPLIVEDRPSEQLIEELGLDTEEEILCGLHRGTPLTERSFGQGHDEPGAVYLFREGIVDEAGGWQHWEDDSGDRWGGPAAIREQIRITLLHEIGHHYGLEEGDLEGLGYG
jgi:predicted Zn-dependent protease with MMP-like domain